MKAVRLNRGATESIIGRLTAATRAWGAAGYPSSGPFVEAREAIFAELRAAERPTPVERLWV